MSKLKIGLVFSGEFPEGEVHNSRIRNIGLGFIKENWICDFISIYPTSFSKQSNNLKQSSWKDQKIIHIGGWYRYPQSFVLRWLQIIYCHLAFIWFILFKTRKYDVLYFYTPQLVSTLPGLLLSKFIGKKIIVDYTDLHSVNKNSKWHKFEEKLIMEYADCLLVISNFLFSHFKSYQKNSFITPMMINFSEFNQSIKPIPFSIGYIGSFGEKDGIPDILDAFSIALKKEPRLTLTMIGRDPLISKTKQKIKSLGLEDYVYLVGGVNHSEIPIYLKKCDTFIMNRKKSIFSDSGYPAKLGDYLACNRPILMSDGILFSSDFNHKVEVLKYEHDNPSNLAEAILYRYNHPEEMLEMSNRGHLYAKERFDSEKISSKVVELANKLINSN